MASAASNSVLTFLNNLYRHTLVDCHTQFICNWIFICCVPWQSEKNTAGKSARHTCYYLSSAKQFGQYKQCNQCEQCKQCKQCITLFICYHFDPSMEALKRIYWRYLCLNWMYHEMSKTCTKDKSQVQTPNAMVTGHRLLFSIRTNCLKHSSVRSRRLPSSPFNVSMF